MDNKERKIENLSKSYGILKYIRDNYKEHIPSRFEFAITCIEIYKFYKNLGKENEKYLKEIKENLFELFIDNEEKIFIKNETSINALKLYFNFCKNAELDEEINILFEKIKSSNISDLEFWCQILTIFEDTENLAFAIDKISENDFSYYYIKFVVNRINALEKNKNLNLDELKLFYVEKELYKKYVSLLFAIKSFKIGNWNGVNENLNLFNLWEDFYYILTHNKLYITLDNISNGFNKSENNILKYDIKARSFSQNFNKYKKDKNRTMVKIHLIYSILGLKEVNNKYKIENQKSHFLSNLFLGELYQRNNNLLSVRNESEYNSNSEHRNKIALNYYKTASISYNNNVGSSEINRLINNCIDVSEYLSNLYNNKKLLEETLPLIKKYKMKLSEYEYLLHYSHYNYAEKKYNEASRNSYLGLNKLPKHKYENKNIEIIKIQYEFLHNILLSNIKNHQNFGKQTEGINIKQLKKCYKIFLFGFDNNQLLKKEKNKFLLFKKNNIDYLENEIFNYKKRINK